MAPHGFRRICSFRTSIFSHSTHHPLSCSHLCRPSRTESYIKQRVPYKLALYPQPRITVPVHQADIVCAFGSPVRSNLIENQDARYEGISYLEPDHRCEIPLRASEIMELDRAWPPCPRSHGDILFLADAELVRAIVSAKLPAVDVELSSTCILARLESDAPVRAAVQEHGVFSAAFRHEPKLLFFVNCLDLFCLFLSPMGFPSWKC